MDKINYFNDSKGREKEDIKYNIEENILRNNVELCVRTSKYAACVSDRRHVCLVWTTITEKIFNKKLVCDSQ